MLVLPPLDVLGLLVEVSAGAVLPEPAPPPDAVKGVAPMVPVFPLALVLLRVWASMRRSCKPVWLIAPLVLRKLLAAMSSRAAVSAPWLLSSSVARTCSSRAALMAPLLRVAPLLTIFTSPWLAIVPLLFKPRPLVSISTACPAALPLMVPLLVNMPSAESCTWPALAPIAPALRTPTPASVPTRLILPAYMPPSWLTSSANWGAAVTGACEDCTSLPPFWPAAAVTVLLPTTTPSSLVQIPALTCAARARMPV